MSSELNLKQPQQQPRCVMINIYVIELLLLLCSPILTHTQSAPRPHHLRGRTPVYTHTGHLRRRAITTGGLFKAREIFMPGGTNQGPLGSGCCCCQERGQRPRKWLFALLSRATAPSWFCTAATPDANARVNRAPPHTSTKPPPPRAFSLIKCAR